MFERPLVNVSTSKHGQFYNVYPTLSNQEHLCNANILTCDVVCVVLCITYSHMHNVGKV